MTCISLTCIGAPITFCSVLGVVEDVVRNVEVVVGPAFTALYVKYFFARLGFYIVFVVRAFFYYVPSTLCMGLDLI